MTYAKVIADSLSPEGVRLTTVEARFHRFVLAEMNTHRALSKNSASSRAIPFEKQIQRLHDGPAVPVVWPGKKAGMQGGEPLSEEDREAAEDIWHSSLGLAAESATNLDILGVHKSLTNRLLEPHMWHTAVITGTAWENFFDQRCSPMAQPEIRVVAEAIRAAMDASAPEPLTEGRWHLPYVTFGEDDYDMATLLANRDGDAPPENVRAGLAKVSAARCARVSYLTQDGVRDPQVDLDLYERLTTAQPPHWSPLEHVATPWAINQQNQRPLSWDFAGGVSVGTNHLPRIGNLLGWRSLRVEVEAAQGVTTYR